MIEPANGKPMGGVKTTKYIQHVSFETVHALSRAETLKGTKASLLCLLLHSLSTQPIL